MSTKPDELLPIDWAGIEIEHRAGITPLRAIAKRFGCTHGAINKRAKREGWIRDLKPKIHARADELVSRAALRAVSSPAPVDTAALRETLTVEANAMALAIVQLDHRAGIGRNRRLVLGLLTELEATCNAPDAYAIAEAMLCETPGLTPETVEDMVTMVRFVATLPHRVKMAKELSDAMRTVVAMEREAFGLNAASVGDGRPLVIIRDYTGRGDPDSPRAQAQEAA